MIFPDIPVEKWLDKHPGLKEGLPLCSCEHPNIRPYRTHKSAGIECTVCGAVLWTRVRPEDNQMFLDLLT